ncbi:MAG: hypothetical protein HYV26_08715 [Candidatus Hydrogenedentes bacterium]|nr:hypothetical protein [Candidatus Hydrogenedentota bacterium]MBI3119842.1 hypothetical protein [Candidatus Hydrogenedentota bacterium]
MPDPIIEEIYRIKDELAEEFGGDVKKLFAHLRELEKQHPERLVSPADLKRRQASGAKGGRRGKRS